MPLRSGETIGRYVIDAVIGHGGMGSVYRAHDTRLQRQVALKVLGDEEKTRSVLSTTGGAARILREARIAAKLEHPNVVAIYDVDEVTTGEHAGLAWLAMELVEGRPLRAYIGDPSIPIATRVRWLTEAARGLAAAHERGLVHRDVKPENIMVREDGVAKVLDFGIARELSGPALAAMGPRSPSSGEPTLELDGGVDAHAATATGKGIVLGTPYYMSPEQMKGETVDARTDQFSWGVVAYELLAGVAPWGKDHTPIRIVAAVLGTEAAEGPLREAGAPGWLVTIVLRAMGKTAGERFGSMGEVVDALGAGGVGIASEEGVRGDLGLIERARTSKALWLLGVSLVALILTIGVGVGRFVRPRAPIASATSSSASALQSNPNACVSNAACSRSVGAPAICVEGACVGLASEDCHVLADENAIKSNSTFWIGSLFPLTGPLAVYGANNERATDLGRQDFADAATGLNASGDGVRAIGVVSCDSGANIDRAARHLVEDLHVAAIMGFPDGTELLRLTARLFAPHRVLALTTLSSSMLVTQLPRVASDPPLVWRTSFNMADCARAVAALAETVIEPQLRAEGDRVTRVTLLRKKTPALLAASERIFDSLRFNGQSALVNGERFQELVYDQGSTAPALETAEKLARLERFGPNIIIYTGESLVKPFLEPFERSLSSRARGRPRYLAMSPLEGSVLDMIGSNTDLRRRIFGVTLPSTTQVNGKLTLHYNGIYGASLSRADIPSTSYDGLYLLAYAAMAVGLDPITGTNLAKAIGRLVPPGVPLEVGPGAILGASATLRSGGSIDLVGTGSPLDLNLQTGDNPTDLSFVCADIDRSGRAINAAESGLLYSSRAGKITGELRCP